MTHNVLQLQEVGDFEALNCLPPQNLIRSTKLHLNTEPPISCRCCYAFVLLFCGFPPAIAVGINNCGNVRLTQFLIIILFYLCLILLLHVPLNFNVLNFVFVFQFCFRLAVYVGTKSVKPRSIKSRVLRIHLS